MVCGFRACLKEVIRVIFIPSPFFETDNGFWGMTSELRDTSPLVEGVIRGYHYPLATKKGLGRGHTGATWLTCHGLSFGGIIDQWPQHKMWNNCHLGNVE